ncbi:MAG: hypothetical protein AAF704_04475 [Cyanobacteria bacterium P01_D01_bin.123]
MSGWGAIATGTVMDMVGAIGMVRYVVCSQFASSSERLGQLGHPFSGWFDVDVLRMAFP